MLWRQTESCERRESNMNMLQLLGRLMSRHVQAAALPSFLQFYCFLPMEREASSTSSPHDALGSRSRKVLLHAFYASFLLLFSFSSFHLSFFLSFCLKHNFMNGRFPQSATELNGRRLKASNSCNYEDCKIQFYHPPELWILWRSLASAMPMMGSSGGGFYAASAGTEWEN